MDSPPEIFDSKNARLLRSVDALEILALTHQSTQLLALGAELPHGEWCGESHDPMALIVDAGYGVQSSPNAGFTQSWGMISFPNTTEILMDLRKKL